MASVHAVKAANRHGGATHAEQMCRLPGRRARGEHSWHLASLQLVFHTMRGVQRAGVAVRETKEVAVAVIQTVRIPEAMRALAGGP